MVSLLLVQLVKVEVVLQLLTESNTGVGVGIDPENMTFATTHGIANSLKANYDNLKAHEVDGQGNNIFFPLVRAQLIAKLEEESNPVLKVALLLI